MRGVLLWLFGATLAFLITAGAFLVLANLSGNLSTRETDPAPARSSSGPPLRLELSQARLEDLQKEAGQTLPLRVENSGEARLTNINLTMRVTSEDTSEPKPRYYRAAIEGLAPGDSKTVRFSIDLSSADNFGGINPSRSDALAPRSILEIQATTPEGISAIKTAVLPL